MDETRGISSADVAIDQDFPVMDEPQMDEPPMFGSDERRMHVRAYNHWVSMLDGRCYPSIEDLDPASIEDFGSHSVLFDLTAGMDNPTIAYLGSALRAEGEISESVKTMADVPARSLLSRLTEHCLEIIANRAPIGFEAEFENLRGATTMYRGILMPFSSDDDTIDFIYGVINWKEVAEVDPGDEVRNALTSALAETMPLIDPGSVWADGPHALSSDDGLDPEPVTLPADADLHDHLATARDVADSVRDLDARSRSALYRALGHAYDFMLTAEDDAEGYAEILEDAGIKVQARAPMVAIAKLVFGVDYEKTRLTEYATVLAHARRIGLGLGALHLYLKGYEGGLKAILVSERERKRAVPATDRVESARKQLRGAATIATIELAEQAGEFVVLVGRRETDGRVAIISVTEAENASLLKAAKAVSGG